MSRKKKRKKYSGNNILPNGKNYREEAANFSDCCSFPLISCLGVRTARDGTEFAKYYCSNCRNKQESEI